MPVRPSLVAASIVAMSMVASASPAAAICKTMGFTVNDYGKEGPTKDAKDLLDKEIAKWAADNGVQKYTVGKKTVKCELFLDVILFDEHTCTATAPVCWNEGGSAPAKTAKETGAKKDGATKEAATPAAADSKPPVETGAIQDDSKEDAAPVKLETPAPAPETKAAAPAESDAAERAAAAAERAAAAAERAAAAAEKAAAGRSTETASDAAARQIAPASGTTP